MPAIAHDLDGVIRNCSELMGLEGEDLVAFFRETDAGRAGKVRTQLARYFSAVAGARPRPVLLVGHPGCGKSTELAKFEEEQAARFWIVRLNARNELDPYAFDPLDLVLVAATRVFMAAVRDGLLSESRDRGMLDLIRGWFAEVAVESGTIREEEIKGEFGIDTAKLTGLLQNLLGFFVAARASARRASQRNQQVREKQLRHLSDLIGAANALFDSIGLALGERTPLLVVDGMEHMPSEPVERLFFQNVTILTDLHMSGIFTFPPPLWYDDRSQNLPFHPIRMPEIATRDRKGRPHPAGLRVLCDVVRARVGATVLADDQLRRIVWASGGNLRDLMKMLVSAAVRSTSTVLDATAVGLAIGELRGQYRLRLADDRDPTGSTAEEKLAEALRAHGDRQTGAIVHNLVTRSLLRAGILQLLDNDEWYGVHPLAVDVLCERGRGNKIDPLRSEPCPTWTW